MIRGRRGRRLVARLPGLDPADGHRLARHVGAGNHLADRRDGPFGRRRPLKPSQMPKVGKHSTGGVGDKVSIVLAPLATPAASSCPRSSRAAAAGWRSSASTKLEAIPGFRVAPMAWTSSGPRWPPSGCADRQTELIRSRGQDALRAARRDRRHREHSADLGVGDEQKLAGGSSARWCST